MNPIELSVFSSRIEAICDEMGAVLRRSAFSPNIKDRLDYSCAVFDSAGGLCAQAAHIPVHLGSMAYATQDIVTRFNWHKGDTVIVNDPFLGGTHLPDVTLISPVFFNKTCIGFVANRAHHADIGSNSPGSMPLSTSIEEEGLIIAPQLLESKGELNHKLLCEIIGVKQNFVEGEGDFAAQISANRIGCQRLEELVCTLGVDHFESALQNLNHYAEKLALSALREIPPGSYCFEDVMDDDGQGHEDVRIAVRIAVDAQKVLVDFTGTQRQVVGNINCPLSVTAAAVYYVFRCLMPNYIPACAGTFKSITLTAPPGCFINAQRPAAVVAGNVETSSRIVDVVMGALAQAVPDKIPAASQGSMNNLALGSRKGKVWDYYETIAGGTGAGAIKPGLNAVQSHMTNTLNTPIEVIEMNYPIRITQYKLRQNSGGSGKNCGGDGIVRSFQFLDSVMVSILSERRRHAAWGLNGGAAGICGENWLNTQKIPAKCTFAAKRNDVLTIKTPGGGGWG